MTSNEQKTINQLCEMVNDIKNENKTLTEKLNKTIEDMNTKVNQKHIPLSLEKDILGVMQSSVQKAIEESLTKYDSPLVKLVTCVVNEHSVELKEIITESFDVVIKKDEFKKAIRDGFSHKVARTIISNNNGLFEKVSNQLKQDMVFKSKMSLAVANVINECLENK